ncbi:hypothetical protein QYE76_040215 [Lolium multiflorum]|uniref:CCHC-type domain-containing protein n=1 Tax=Lolium multiflorum TaxID=4521 RepID=A0AAD8WSH9_LOLMU|nr:hypothetical protein QYE76_040215 [Lolium multiflorum]
MMQLLQTMMADREVERAERQANITALQQIAQNNQGHGNHDHPGSKLKNFQHTNPPMFNKTEEPLDADDWLQTMENNLEVAGVEAAEKVLFATHYLSGPARAWWTSARAMNAGQMMTWEDFKLKFSKYHVPQGLIKKMRDEFRELKQGRMSVVEYRDRFLTLSRYAPDETDTNEKRKERFLNGLHDEMQTVLVNIPFADLEALVDSAIQMEGKLHQANENRKRRMMNQSGPHHTQKYRNNSSGGFNPRYNKPPAQNYRPNNHNNNGGPPKTGGNNNNNHNNNNHPNNSNNNGNNNNTNTAPRTGSNATPIIPKDKSTVNCYECGVVGHFSNECPKKLARIAANTATPAQQQRRFAALQKVKPMSKNSTMPAMMDMPMLNPTLALSSLHNLAKLAHLSLLSTLDIVPGQGEHDNARTTLVSPRRPRQSVHQQHLDAPGRHRANAIAIDDLARSPRSHLNAIYRGHQSTSPSHHSLPHFSLALLNPSSTPITASRAGIARSSPPESADQRRRLTPPKPPTVPDASSSTSTSPRTSPSTAGGLQRPSTPYLRCPHALLSPEKKTNPGRPISF